MEKITTGNYIGESAVLAGKYPNRKKTCISCGVSYFLSLKKTLSRAKYCGRVCSNKAPARKNPESIWSKYNIKKCDVCSRKLVRTTMSGKCIFHKEYSQSHRDKIRLAHLGKKHKNHKKGYFIVKDRTKLVMSEKKHLDTKYKYWMLEVKKRDGWKCKMLNNDCNGRLEAHHILSWRDYPDLRYELNNGITLCVFHHPRKRSEENRLSPYFQELINKK